ncbi:hypothetical protein E1B28_003594 [Marasmius oreades]|uniref:F-box domain-containing protein n=1 Tax=Marasmius oreades TaxID=181124 RepID=A0A9P7RMJ0_9AGAR|nr:uncharacterized protein E1B28_003594 [Marasmius oreades]KAG7086077.1 hypothetical protein E1B28_003594 [Marasmius oreades]
MDTVPPRLRPINPNFLHSTYVPCKAEVSRMSEMLTKDTKKLKQYKTEIDLLRRKLEQLETQEQDLETRIEKCCSVLAVTSQRKLPREIWENIFHIACFSHSQGWYRSLIIRSDVYRGRRQKGILSVPIILTHVCSRWREIVTQCPRLWASIHIRLWEGYPRSGKKLVKMVLANSAPCPLTLRIFLFNYDVIRERVRATCEVLADHFSRCERLFVYFGASARIDPLTPFRGQNITFNNLGFFSFYGNRSDELDIDNPFCQALRHAPKLTGVELGYILYPLNLLPNQQITTLSIATLDVHHFDDFLLVLEVSRCLCALKLKTFYTHRQDDPPGLVPRRVELPCLSNLSICFYHPPTFNDPMLEVLLSSLVLPSLSSYELSCAFPSDITYSHWPSWLCGMLQYSSATLRHLQLTLSFPYDTVNWDMEPLSVLINTVPRLDHLHLRVVSRGTFSDWGESMITHFLSDLADVKSDNAIVPNLTYLCLTKTKLTFDIIRLVVDVAASRSPSRLSAMVDVNVRPLEELRVIHFEPNSPSRFVEPYREAIEGLERDGVKIVI